MKCPCLLFVPAAIALMATAGPIYTLADLGTLGGASAMASGVNSLGQTVGSMTTAAGDTYAFITSGSSYTNLTANSSVATGGMANGINNTGQIAGTQYIGGQPYATLWTNGVATTVGGAGSYGMAIDNAGDIAGMLLNNGEGSAFVTQNGVVTPLGAFDSGSWSSAYGLNNQGKAAGYGMTSTGNFAAFTWTPGQGYSVLGTLGGTNSYAMAINDAGAIVGSAQIASGYVRATKWNGTSIQNLGTLGGVSSSAYGINDLGNVVGTSLTSNNAGHGFLEEGGFMYDINALLIDDPGWVITDLYAINGSNQIVGTGIFDGVEHAVLLTDPPAASTSDTASTPEPASWILTLTGSLFALLLRLRRARRTH
jgi:probable HAF family extracellular repeat protein